jgi:hypothetical protein
MTNFYLVIGRSDGFDQCRTEPSSSEIHTTAHNTSDKNTAALPKSLARLDKS